MGLVGAVSGVVCWSGDWWAHRAESSAGHGNWEAQRAESCAGLTTGGRSKRSRLLVLGLVGAASGVVCWSCDWRAWQAESSAGHWRLMGASSGVVYWSGGKWTQRAEASAGLATGGAAMRSCLLVVGLEGAASGIAFWS